MAEAPLALDTLPLWRRLALGATMFFITGVFGLIQPFTAPYLLASGLDRFEINVVGGLASLLAVLIQPLFGRVSDRLDARRPMMLVTAALAAGAYFLFPKASGVGGFLLLTVLGANSLQYLNTTGGVLIGRLAGASRGGAAYARFRVWGSVGYVAVTQTVGYLLPSRPGMARADLEPIFTVGTVALFAVIAVLSCFVPDVKAGHRAGASPDGSASPAADQGDLENLNRFLLAYFLYQFALYGASANLSLYLTETLHATKRDLSNFFAVGVVSEVLVMTQVGRWTDRHGRKPALMAAFLLMPVRLLCYIPATGALWASAVQSLHGVNFGIVGAIAVTFVNDCAPERQRGAIQARLAGTGGLAVALGQWVCGFVLQRWGFGAMFGAMSAVGAVGAALLWTRVRESHPDLRTAR